jgi:eukaryotic-like serine/threonine-protein kinase
MTDQRDDLPPDQWRRVKQVFGAVLELEPRDRAAFLDEACGTADAAVRREVEALLAAHQASDSFLETPAAAVALPLTPSRTELAEGQTLGSYRVLRTLGHGGMATVYLAHDSRHRRPVALKVLHPDLAHALGPERFLREIEVAANLTHPHILPLHDSGEAGGLLYYVMPYVEGESLRDRLTREIQLPVDEALQIAHEVADALAYAHGQGVIHRDIKPENILLSGGHALVADFGIARALGQAGGERLTETGMALGTAAYMSPEQASGERQVDGRSDVYSLGCVLYEMLAGEPPYTGPSARAIMAKRFSDPVPSVRRVRPAVPEGLEHAVTKALAPVAADRFATAAEFTQALQPTLATPTGTPSAPTGHARRHVPLAAVALVVGIIIGVGVLFAWRRTSPGRDETSAGAKRVAVLPFENLGDSADAYFADGVANDLRSKLSQIEGLAVIARGSSNEYMGTTKTQPQIARELGVDYLLTATVQWEKVPGGPSRVRVTPELVDVRPGHAPETRWGRQFDAAMTGVFQVQADIAGQVAQALHVALGKSTVDQLAVKATQSLPAYDAFLRGEAASQSMSVRDPPRLRQAIAAYEQAVALDSSFVLAWAQLARARSQLYQSGFAPTPARAEAARHAAERAVALAPDRAEGHQALAAYYRAVLRDNPRAHIEDSTALVLDPNNAEVLGALGWSEVRLGRWESARGHLEQAVALNPRSVSAAVNLGTVLLFTRQYSEAERVFDRALQLAPANLDALESKAMVALAQGDLPKARAVLRAGSGEVDPTAVAAYVAQVWDLYWVLDDSQQQLLVRLTPSAFDDNRDAWGIALAETYALQGNWTKARIYADSARQANEQMLQAMPDNPDLHVFRGVQLAYLGEKEAAIKEAKRGIALVPITKDPYAAAYYQYQLVRIYLLVGEPEKALDQLEPLLKIPYYLSPGWLKIDPTFDPLRGNPRFERLVNGNP